MISIIIPTLCVKKKEVVNSITHIQKTQSEKCEIIFSEGKNRALSPHFDDIITEVSPLSSKQLLLKLVENPNPSKILYRGASMNLAAKLAKGNILLFLHIDTYLAKEALKKVKDIMENDLFVGGGFLKKYDKAFLFAITQSILNMRTYFFKETVGTNAIFIRTDIFKEHKYPEHFMEDFVFSKSLIKTFSRKRIHIIKDKVTVSARKYRNTGSFKNTFINAIIILLFYLKKRDYHKLNDLYKTGNKTGYYTIIKKALHIIKNT